MTNLTNIYLQSNRLLEIPEDIKSLVNLEILDVGNNQMSKLPQSIGHLRVLKKLIVTQNQLTSVPESIGQLTHLVSLQLSHNRLHNLPYSLIRCVSLQELHIDRNVFRTLPNFLTRLPNLQTLSACGNQLAYLPCLPFAAIQRFLCDSNCDLSHLPYPLACQMNRTPLNPLVTRDVLYITCYGCFQTRKELEGCVNVSVQDIEDVARDADNEASGGAEWKIHLPPGLSPSRSTVVPKVAELVLRSLVTFQFGKVMTVACVRNVHHFKVGADFVRLYDEWVESLGAALPSTVIEQLRRGPAAFCFNADCLVPIFRATYPVFVVRTLVQRQTDSRVALQRVLCCLLFCSPICFHRYRHHSAQTLGTTLDGWSVLPEKS